MGPMNAACATRFSDSEKRKAGQFVRPNFDKTPIGQHLLKRQTGGDHAPAISGKPAFRATVSVV
jgi:hypothetical protein